MREQLIQLREEMKKRNIDAYLIPSSDFHGSEYVNEYFKCRSYMSGFTGSAGTLLVTGKKALLWTDGRYFLQAAAQLFGSGIELMKMGEDGVPSLKEYICATLSQEQTLAFDGRVISCSFVESLGGQFNIKQDEDLVNLIWADRPQLAGKKIYDLPESVTGESAASKLARLRTAMKEKGADYHLITKLEDIAWLYNLRGEDIQYTPVFFAFALIEADRDRLYVLDDSFVGAALPYFQIFDDLKALPKGKLLLDKRVASYAMVADLPGHIEIIDEPNPCELMKAIKNDVEIAGTREAHISDGLAVTRFIYWLKKAVESQTITEISAANFLEEERRKEGCFSLSFETISGYGSNGAIIHYAATEETNKTLEPKGFLLVDSGGHYMIDRSPSCCADSAGCGRGNSVNGTTDITRTIGLGALTDKMKRDYTTVLKCNLRLSAARFWPGTTGQRLDDFTRVPLQELDLDYNHGTGHGVGHLLSVHEGPNSISKRGESVICSNMITTNEPGVYIEGEYGIRLENEMLCIETGYDELGFEVITYCPFDRQAIIPELLEDEEIEALNSYHRMVYEVLSPHLDEDVRQWLAEETSPIIK